MATPGNPSYNRTAALVLGILQVLIGAANIIVQIVMYAEDLYIIGPASVGVWTGMFVSSPREIILGETSRIHSLCLAVDIRFVFKRKVWIPMFKFL